jgi:hypothetical protein
MVKPGPCRNRTGDDATVAPGGSPLRHSGITRLRLVFRQLEANHDAMKQTRPPAILFYSIIFIVSTHLFLLVQEKSVASLRHRGHLITLDPGDFA